MIIIKKKYLVFFMFLLVFSVLLSGAVMIYSEASDKADEVSVIVDAGHGDPDGGAVGVGGTLEKDINLSIAMKLSEVLEGKGFHVIMTRTGDRGIYDNQNGSIREKKREDMKKRLSIMKKSNSDVFISIHMNSFENSSANGLNVFYSSNHEEIKELAEKIQARIAEVTGVQTHSVKTADERLFLMKKPPIPAVLVECGFLSNAEEEKKLNDEEYQSRLAWAIAEAVDEFY